MEAHRYKYSVVKMASRLDVSVRSYYDYRNGIYRKRSLQRAINEQIVNNSFELFVVYMDLLALALNYLQLPHHCQRQRLLNTCTDWDSKVV